VEVKICGVRDEVTCEVAVSAGASAIGFVFAASPRRLDPERAARIAESIPDSVARVAVFRHPSPAEVHRVLDRFPADIVQTEEGAGAAAARERGVRLLPVLHDGPGIAEDLTGLRPGPVLLEAAGRGGRGVRPDWTRAARIATRFPLVLAGGLTPDNVGDAIRRVRPVAVDVSSGVESSIGNKDPELIRDFLAATMGPAVGEEPGDGTSAMKGAAFGVAR
jgi:phosphoribosylanthranilate isomerase